MNSISLKIHTVSKLKNKKLEAKYALDLIQT